MSKEQPAVARFTRYWLLVIFLAFVVLSGVYSVVTPVFEGPDEIWHFAFANHLADGGGLPVFDAAEPATFLRNGAHPPVYYGLIAMLIAPIDRSDFPAAFRFNLANPLITPGANGTSPNLLIHTAHEDWPWRNATLAAHLARCVSIALNALALWGVWRIARRILHNERVALLALGMAAGVPQFVYGAAMINNDALAAATTTWLVYALLRWLDDQSARWTISGGVMLGLALLSKIGLVALLPVPALAIVLHALRNTQHARRHWRQLILAALIIYSLAFIIAGWWYLRNWSLYGDPLAWREWQALTGAGRVPPTIGDFIGDMRGLFGTFWVDFSLRVDRTWWPIFGVIGLVALIGLVRRAIKREWPLDWPKLLIALSVFALLLASAVRYSFNIYDIHGRLLYPSLAAIGVVLALGMSKWPRAMSFALLTIPLAFTLVSPLMIIQPAYARPIVSALPEGSVETTGSFGAYTELLGYRLKSDRVKVGEPLELETYWRSIADVDDQDVRQANIMLLAPDGSIVGHTLMPLGTDAYPRDVWQPNEIVVTRFVVSTTVDHPTLATVSLTVPPLAQLRELRRVTIWIERACEVDWPVDVTFGGLIKLIGYRIEAGGVPRLVLCWQAVKPVPIDYTVFVHVPGANGQISGDSQPVSGNYPTSVWQPGEIVEDVHSLSTSDNLPIPRASIGFYRLDTGERLTIDGTHETEFIIQNEP
ncbi:MAG: glycosyltransferase family 39 protein [Chloroflexi bacterium]|nr:glycosyltransferase family 39 protein [Chloroflexota bacterium]